VSATAKTRAPIGQLRAAHRIRIALAVPALVVRAHDSQAVALQDRDPAEHLLAHDRMRLHPPPLCAGQLARLQRI
jgi:hypothetical protein